MAFLSVTNRVSYGNGQGPDFVKKTWPDTEQRRQGSKSLGKASEFARLANTPENNPRSVSPGRLALFCSTQGSLCPPVSSGLPPSLSSLPFRDPSRKTKSGSACPLGGTLFTSLPPAVGAQRLRDALSPPRPVPPFRRRDLETCCLLLLLLLKLLFPIPIPSVGFAPGRNILHFQRRRGPAEANCGSPAQNH